jgi:branched-chain amino acid transport system permease protein
VAKLLQTLVNSIALGSLYALIALGYSLVYGVLRFINFAHSDVFTVGAWVSFTMANAFGWAVTGSPWFAMPLVLLLAMGFCAILGISIEALAYRPLRKAPRLNVLITAIGVSLFLQNFGQLKYVFGTQPQRMPALIQDRVLASVAGVNVRLVDLVVVVLAFTLMAGLQWLVFRTKLGSAMRAVSFDERVAQLMGINVNMVVSVTFGIGSALAAAGGLLFALKYESLKQTADATWVLLGLKAFVAAVVGGIGDVRGAVAGALLIAFVEIFGAAYVSPDLRDLYVFVILIAVLLLKPSGLFGKAVVEKV